MGFNEKKSKTVDRLQLGDRFLCYLSKASAFVGVMEVAGASYLDRTPIWSDGVFPVRLPVRIVTELPLVLAAPIHSRKGRLSFLPLTMTTTGWTIYGRSSPRPVRSDVYPPPPALRALELRFFAGLWIFREYPNPDHEWTSAEKSAAVKAAGFERIRGRLVAEAPALCADLGLDYVLYIDADASDYAAEF